jgi:VTC domain
MNTNHFAAIQLEEMDQVKLMNRIDQKFWFHEEKLQRILQAVSQHYYVLDIEGQNEFPYTSTYYDTTENRMYTKHHNGNLSRYKIRSRSYVSSGISFLEVKFKNNKGRTFKKRIPTNLNEHFFTKEESEFIHANTPYLCGDLSPSLTNQFSRVTLVNKNFKERCTIDRNLKYTKDDSWIQLENLAIIEIKTDGRKSLSPLALALREERIRASGFSKYCMGRVLTDKDLKRNSFKRKIRKIEKTIHAHMNLYNI